MSADKESTTLFPLDEVEKRSKARKQPRSTNPDQLSSQLVFTGETWEEIKVWDSVWFAKAQEMKVKLAKHKDNAQGRKSQAEWRHALDVYTLAAYGLTQTKIAEAIDMPFRSFQRIISHDRYQKPIKADGLRALMDLIYEGYWRGLKLKPFYENFSIGLFKESHFGGDVYEGHRLSTQEEVDYYELSGVRPYFFLRELVTERRVSGSIKEALFFTPGQLPMIRLGRTSEQPDLSGDGFKPIYASLCPPYFPPSR